MLSRNILTRCRRALSARATWERSLADSETFWGDAGKKVHWHKKPEKILNCCPKTGTATWFEGGELSTCYNALDRHVVAGKGQRPAVMFESAITGRSETYTYDEMLSMVSECAAVLRNLGVKKGETVVIYMPNIPEAVVAMLACSRYQERTAFTLFPRAVPPTHPPGRQKVK